MAVYLRAQPDCLAARISADDHLHPFLDDRPEDALRTMFVARDHCYERMADHVVDVDELDVAHATPAVLEAICSAGVRLPYSAPPADPTPGVRRSPPGGRGGGGR